MHLHTPYAYILFRMYLCRLLHTSIQYLFSSSTVATHHHLFVWQGLWIHARTSQEETCIDVNPQDSLVGWSEVIGKIKEVSYSIYTVVPTYQYLENRMRGAGHFNI